MTAPDPTARAWLRGWLGGPLDQETRRGFAVETGESNLRRLRVLLPIMVVLHLVHIALFRASDATRTSLTPQLLRWRGDLVLAHGATLALALPLAVLVYARGSKTLARVLPPLTTLLYLVHGAVIAGIDQLVMPNVTVFIGYALGAAVVLSLPPLETILVYVGGLATFVAAIDAMQPSATDRLMVLPNGFSICVVSIALAFLLQAARRRDYAQRRTIGAQREELSEMNAGLERRVNEQVSEIVQRAKEIETLNAQLKAQVRARSSELSMALAKLAKERDGQGRLRKGVVLGERFEIDELIGEGGMGAVYSGVDRSGGARVAIKVIQASSAQQLDALHRFLREAGTAATVTHPAVVRMLHVDVSADGMLFQVQELVEGETLYTLLQHQGPWEAGRTARLGAVLSDALAAAHAQRVVHRDVKPGNIMITRAAPGLKLLDFGVSKLLRPRDRDTSSGSGEVVGTPSYMAPEQLAGTRKLTDRADVYATGVLLFRLLSGEYPFDDAATRDLVLRRQVGTAPDVRTRASQVPAELAELVARCLRIEPEERPEAKDVARALGAFADAREVPPLEVVAREPSLSERAQDRGETATVAEGKRVERAAARTETEPGVGGRDPVDKTPRL